MDGDLIKLVNKLQDTFSNLGGELDMPQLAVVRIIHPLRRMASCNSYVRRHAGW